MSQDSNVFGRLLDQLVRERFGNAARFVAAILAAKGQASESKLSRILSGEMPPQLDEMRLWIRLLKLKDPEAQTFLIEAELAKLRQAERLDGDEMPACGERIAKLSAMVEKLARDNAELKVKYQAVRDLVRPGAPNPPPSGT